MNLDALAPLAPLLILGLWSLLVVALARVDLPSGPGIHRPLALSGALLALLAALTLVGDPAHDVGTLLAGGGLVVDPLALFASALILLGLVSALLLARPGPHAGPRAALALLTAAGLLVAVHATDLLGLVAGLEVAGLGLGALLAVDRRTRAAAWDWLIGHGLSASLLLLGVALVVGATGTSRIADLGARVGMVFTRWGASPAQAAVDLLQSGVPIPEALAEQARTRAVTAMAPAALFIPGMLLTFAALLARLGLAPFALAAGRVYERAPLGALPLIELGLRLAALIALIRLFAGVFHVARQLHAPYGWSTAATLIAGLTLVVTAVQALRQREPRRLLATTTAAVAAWSVLGLTAAANFYAHAQSHARTLTVVDHHEWGMRSGDHAIAAVLTLALAQALAALGLLAALAALGDPAPGRGTLVFHGLARRRPLLALALVVHLLALLGLPPTLAFAARLDLLAALLVDTNPAIRLLAALALLAALPLALAWARHLLALFERPADPPAAPSAADRPPSNSQASDDPTVDRSPARLPTALALVLALLLLALGLAPAAALRGAELAAAATATPVGASARARPLAALRQRWDPPPPPPPRESEPAPPPRPR